MLLLLLSFCFNQYDAQPSSTHREFVTSITSFDEDFKSTTSTKEVELISSTSSLQEVPILPDKCTILSLTSLQEVAKPIVKKNMSNKAYHIKYGNRARGQRARGIKIISWNKGSAHLINRIEVIKQLTVDYKPHILALQEAEISQDTDITKLQIQGYHLYTDPIHRNGGNSRTCVYVHSDLTVKQRPDLESQDLSLISLTVGRPRQRKFNFLAFYRQWSVQGLDSSETELSRKVPSQAERFQSLTELWAASIAERETISASDTNLSSELLLDQRPYPARDARHLPIARHFHENILPSGIVILNNEPTHYSPLYPPAIIDHLTSTNPGMITDVRTITHGSSDHRMVSCVRRTKAPVTIPRYRITRDYRGIDHMTMNNLLRENDQIKEAAINPDPTQAAESFLAGTRAVLDYLAPARRVQTRHNPVPYISDETRRLQSQRDREQDIARQSNDPEDWRQYRSTRNKANQSIKNDQSTHIKNKVESGNPSIVWRAVKQITGGSIKGPPNQISINGQTINSPSGIACGMNKFFIDKINRIRSSIPISNLDPLAGLKRMTNQLSLSTPLSIHPISRIELRKIIRSMRPTKSTGVDGISMKLIKDHLGILEPAIHNIVTQSILQGTFPEVLKTSKVLPIQKPETISTNPASYRPINILPALSKIIEKVVFTQVIQYVDKIGIISHHHHGSSPGHSPVTALLSMYQQLIENAENGEMSALLALDNSAAFDIVDHPLLLMKMEEIGFAPDTLRWMDSFLSNRMQVTEVESFLSPPLQHPPCSIIQGSIGSCILYQIFTVDLPQAIHPHPPHPPHEETGCSEGTVTTYVDDASAILKAKTPEKLAQLAQSALDNIGDYLTSNKLKQNSDKSKLLVVPASTQSNPNPPVSIQAEEKVIQPSTHFRILGVIMSNDLRWDKYISQLHSQLTARLISIRNLSKYANIKVLKMVASSLIFGKINFALALWSGLNIFQQKKIQTIILSTARACLGPISARWSTHHLLQSMGWMGFTQLAECVSSQMVHQILTTSKPSFYIFWKDKITIFGCSCSIFDRVVDFCI